MIFKEIKLIDLFAPENLSHTNIRAVIIGRFIAISMASIHATRCMSEYDFIAPTGNERTMSV